MNSDARDLYVFVDHQANAEYKRPIRKPEYLACMIAATARIVSVLVRTGAKTRLDPDERS
jgi:hypothetical protein